MLTREQRLSLSRRMAWQRRKAKETSMSPKHPQDDGKPYTCQDTPDLFAERIRRKRIRSEATKKAWRSRKRMRSARAAENVSQEKEGAG